MSFACVFKLGGHYLAAHYVGSSIRAVSEHPESVLETAQATARSFALAQNIPYDEDLKKFNKPIITVIKSEELGGEWFPAKISSNKIKLLTAFGPVPLGGSRQEATNMAKVIALSLGTDCIPSIGISLTPPEKL